ncbi:MAG: hypothetical protein KDB56_15880 [Mycobacterium sp.]|nr:hypothetical protein [Mycobacterium sp.]
MTPVTVRRAAALVALQGVVGLVAAVVFLIRGLAGADRHIVNGFGNAAWFAVFAAALLSAAWALRTGRRWGRGIAVFIQLLLLPVAWYAGAGSHRWLYGIPVAVIALAVLALLFAPSTLRWMSYSATSSERASADSSGPQTR